MNQNAAVAHADTAADPDRFARAIAAIDRANSEDPNTVPIGSRDQPGEVVYSQRMTQTLAAFCPDASQELRLAVRGQHICRWIMARSDYETGRVGYLKWRTALKRYHAVAVGEIMAECGYGEDQIGCVQSLIRKERLKHDADAQTLEDVACLVFLQHYAADFAARHERTKIISILRKTWGKMSDRGHEAALALDLPAAVDKLVATARSDI